MNICIQVCIYNDTIYNLCICCRHIFYFLINAYIYFFFVFYSENRELKSDNTSKQQHSVPTQVRGKPRNRFKEAKTRAEEVTQPMVGQELIRYQLLMSSQNKHV